MCDAWVWCVVCGVFAWVGVSDYVCVYVWVNVIVCVSVFAWVSASGSGGMHWFGLFSVVVLVLLCWYGRVGVVGFCVLG